MMLSRINVGLLSIVSLDVQSLENKSENLLTSGGTIYANASSIYVANPHWWWTTRPTTSSSNKTLDSMDATYIHKFNWNGGNIKYAASGTINGTLRNQFPMDEHNGFLRTASTKSPPTGLGLRTRCSADSISIE